MDKQIEIGNAKPNGDDEFALHKLNDHCLLKIFTYLRPRDAENLSKTSKRLKNLSLYPMHKLMFEIRSDMVTNTTEQNITELDALLAEYGEHIKSWSLRIVYNERSFDRGVEALQRVSQYCKNLKKLEIIDRQFLECVACEEVAASCFENVEYLNFVWGQEIHSDFLRFFRKLKHVHFQHTGTTATNLQMLFKNNQDIESFHIDGGDGFSGSYHCFENFCSEFNLCEFGPKFQKLCLGATCEFAQMGSMQRLAATNLTHLKLDVLSAVDLHIFLAEMAKTGNLKELELKSFKFDRTWFDVLQLFQKLELLVIRPGDSSDLSSAIWPPNLKYLSTNLRLTNAEFISTIGQLKHLERLQLSQDSKIDLRPLSLEGILVNVFNREVRRPALQLTCEMKLVIIDFERKRVLYNISGSEYKRLRITPADFNNFVGIDFTIRNYPGWQWSAKKRIDVAPGRKFRRLSAGSEQAFNRLF